MRYRSTLIYLVAALILGGVYFLDIRSEKKEETRKEEAKVLFQEMPENLTRLVLERGDRTVVIEKTGAGEEDEKAWTVKAPVKTGADGYSVNRITSILPHLKYARIIQESTDDPASFGLDSPALTLTWAGEGRKGTLSIGGESPIDKGFYAKTGDGPRVFLLAGHDKEVLDKTLYDLRDKRLFTFPYDQVTRLTVERPAESWSFVKSGETTWALEKNPAFSGGLGKGGLGGPAHHLGGSGLVRGRRDPRPGALRAGRPGTLHRSSGRRHHRGASYREGPGGKARPPVRTHDRAAADPDRQGRFPGRNPPVPGGPSGSGAGGGGGGSGRRLAGSRRPIRIKRP